MTIRETISAHSEESRWNKDEVLNILDEYKKEIEKVSIEERYFIISFNLGSLFGDYSLSSIGYPNRTALIEYIKNNLKSDGNLIKIDGNLIILNIIELNKTDYESYNN